MNETNNLKLKKLRSGLVWFWKSCLWLIPLLLALDILSKLGFERLLKSKPDWAITVIPGFFRFALLYNTGAAWGLFAGKDWLLVTISCVAGVVLIGCLTWKFKKMPKYQIIAFSLMIPGCLGNLIDRAFYKNGVIDFLEFTFGKYSFPTFNFADSYLVIGVFVLIIGEIWLEYSDKKKQAKVKAEAIAEEKLTADIKEFEAEERAKKASGIDHDESEN